MDKRFTAVSDCANCAERQRRSHLHPFMCLIQNSEAILVVKRHGGSWVSHIPSRFKNCRHVCTATWMGLRWPMPSKCPWAPCLRKIPWEYWSETTPKKNLAQRTCDESTQATSRRRSFHWNSQVTSFTSIEMVHTHTHCWMSLTVQQGAL